MRQIGRSEYRIKRSTKFHMMSANEHGNWEMMVCPNDLNGDIFFLDDLHDKSIINDDFDDENEADDVDYDNLEYHILLFLNLTL